MSQQTNMASQFASINAAIRSKLTWHSFRTSSGMTKIVLNIDEIIKTIVIAKRKLS